VEDIPDPVVGDHQHIDMVYVCTPNGARNGPGEYAGAQWVPADEVGQLHTPPELADFVAACVAYVAEVGARTP
jgi:hypothetical protein